jgi:acyl dehydratase
MAVITYEDMRIGAAETAGPYCVSRDQILAFAGDWDPMPFHVDDAAAARSLHGGLTASGIHTIAINQLLLHRVGISDAVLGALGYDDMRFPHPVRPGDCLTLTTVWIDKRLSRSRPDCGIVRRQVTVTNQDGAAVLSYTNPLLVARRG